MNLQVDRQENLNLRVENSEETVTELNKERKLCSRTVVNSLAILTPPTVSFKVIIG